MDASFDSKFSKIFQSRYHLIGDIFEIFAEIFFLAHQADNRVGVYGYTPVRKNEDNGVDGHGSGIDGEPAAVQVKYRGNPAETLKERDIKNFGFQAQNRYGVPVSSTTNMVVFTNSEGLHWHTDAQVSMGKVRSINGRMISSMIDNNMCFWKFAQETLRTSSESLLGVSA